MAQTLSSEEVQQRLAAQPGWATGADGQLTREYAFPNFAQALMFLNAAAYLAEQMDHHPDLLLHSYNKVRISVSTHDANGITEKDFNLVAAIDGLPRKA